MVHRARRRNAPESDHGEGFWENMILSWRLYRDPRVSVWLKRLPVVGAIIYLIMPFDLIPDIMLGAGQLDDIGVMGLMALSLTWLPKFAPADVVAEHRSRMKNRGRYHGTAAPGGGATHGQEVYDDVIEPPFRVRR